MRFATALLAGLSLLLPALSAADDAHRHDDPYRHEHGEREEHGEQQIVLSPAAAAAAGIVTAIAAPAELHQTLTLHGRIAAAGDGEMAVAAPFAGIIESVAVEIGDHVAAGATLATVRNSDSLQRYAVTAPRAGVVTERHVGPGAATDGQPLLTLTDTTRVWASVAAFPADLPRLQTGQPAAVASTFGGQTATATVDYIAPVTSIAGQVTAVRLMLPNPAGEWRPGQAVTATITVAQTAVPLAVAVAAVQRLEEQTVVFVRRGDVVSPCPVTLGRRDERWVEVLAGLRPGEEYVAANSFLVKADLLKSGASHAH